MSTNTQRNARRKPTPSPTRDTRPIVMFGVVVPYNGRAFVMPVPATNKAAAIEFARVKFVKDGLIPSNIDVRFSSQANVATTQEGDTFGGTQAIDRAIEVGMKALRMKAAREAVAREMADA